MIEVSGLTIVDGAGRPVVDRVSLEVGAGERVGIVGESGSGKTTLALALLGAIRPGLRVAEGTVEVSGHDMRALRGAALRRMRGRVISYLPQDPGSALTPTLRVRRQITELSDDRSPAEVARRLTDVGLPGDRQFQRRFPHQLSGGQQQRLAVARTCAADPRVLVLDEPTTGLDALIQGVVLEQLDHLVRVRELTMLFITHDLAAAARMADRLVVMRSGAIVEQGSMRRVLHRPTAAYTRDLVAAVPRPVAGAETSTVPDDHPLPAVGSVRTGAEEGCAAKPVLAVRDLHAAYRDGRQVTPVVAGVSFEVHAGECVALLGLSGSGKTTIARCVTGLHRPAGGELLLAGERLAEDARDRPPTQRRRIQLVPQHSAGSLNPRRRVGPAIARPLRLRGFGRTEAEDEVRRLLNRVGLPDSLAARYPDQLSGGQRQRVTIARALAAAPELLICDEMTSNL
ncbi:MAG TPA: ABC transporter ATP-binding protein, partial [Micromonosporaceae bacterium]